MHKQYLLIKGKPEGLIVGSADRRVFLKIKKEDAKPFVLRVPASQISEFKEMLHKNGYTILSQKNGTRRRVYKSINGHSVKVYGKDLLVEIKADTEEELFQESKIVREELKTEYGIDSHDKCKWICFR